MSKRNHKVRPASNPIKTVANPALDAEITRAYAQAVAQHQQGNLQEATRLYKAILEHQPEHADSLHYLGVIAHQQGNNQLASKLIERAIIIKPKQAAYHYNLATIYQSLQELETAIRHYKLTLKYKPDHLQALGNLAVIYHDQDKVIPAKQAYQAALKIDPGYPVALLNLGTLLNQIGHYDQASTCFSKLLVKHPMLAEARFKKAQISLLQADYQAGWEAYHWMYLTPSFLERNPPRLIPFSKWDGSSLQGKRLLINADLGVGDVLMFTSCLPDVLQITDNVVLECENRLIPLLMRSFPGIDFIPASPDASFFWNRKFGHIDCRIKLSELPALFRLKPDDFPVHEGYLHPEKKAVQNWRNILQAMGGKLNVGISWRGGSDDRSRKARSLPLLHWQALAAIPGINLINLQYGDHSEEITQFNHKAASPLHTLEGLEPISNLDGFAALLTALDLVISVDNTTVHFAGALNVPVWMVLPLTPDWRWLLKRKDTPWYPSATLFRADAMGFDALLKQLKMMFRQVKNLQEHQDTTLVALLEQTQARCSIASESTATETDTAELGAGTRGQLFSQTTNTDYVLLLNDTIAWYHWGCSCTSGAIHHHLREQWQYVKSVSINETRQLTICPQTEEQFDAQDLFDTFCKANPNLIDKLQHAAAVVINGEGTLHRLNQTSLGLLYLAWIAKTRFGRKVSIINHSCYPDGADRNPESMAYSLYRKVYQVLDYVTVRERISAEEFVKMQVPAIQAFDSLPLYIDEIYRKQGASAGNSSEGTAEPSPYIVIAASAAWGPAQFQEMAGFIQTLHAQGWQIKLLVGASAHLAADDIQFVQALNSCIGPFCKLVYANSEREWLITIEQASLLVSGRFHHSIAAAFLSTPFIVMGSNTPKIAGLLNMLELDVFLDDSQPAMAERLQKRTIQLLNNPQSGLMNNQVRERLLALARLNFP